MRHIFSIIIAALFLFYPSYGFTEIKEIVSEGAYNMGDGETPSVAESMAFLNAKRIALEQAGTYVESLTKVENFQLTKDEIQVMSSGLMEVEILDKKRTIVGDGFRFWVKIKASVNPDRIEEMAKKVKEKSVVEDYKKIQAAYDKSRREIEKLRKQLAEAKDKKKKQIATKISNNEKMFQANEWLDRGREYDLKKEYDKAIEAYTSAIALNPNDSTAYNNRGVLYYEKGQYDMAIKDFNRLTTLTPDIVYLGRLFSATTIEDLNKEIDSNPKDFLAYYRRGLEYMNKGNIDKAISDFRKICAMGYKNGCKELQKALKKEKAKKCSITNRSRGTR